MGMRMGMNNQQKQRLSEIRQGAKSGIREGYLRTSGIKTLPALDVDVLIARIDRLEAWIKKEAKRSGMCTCVIFTEACKECLCHSNKIKL